MIVIPYNNDVILEAAVQRYSVKKMFLEVLQNWHEDTRATDFFLLKFQDLQGTFSYC